MKITANELRSKYLEFFKSKNHIIIPSSSLVPENDPTVLFTTAGMHPLVPYLSGQKHPLGKRLVSVQKCIRTGDIDEVGDAFHHTFFEMLGNWSLGDYFKKEVIEYSFEFLTKTLKLDKNKLAVSCFAGDSDSDKDNESSKVWESLGIPKHKIVYLPKKNNWWGPAGQTGPCGPDTEMFYYIGKDLPKQSSNPKDNEDEWVEIWNNVFMQYNKTKEGKYEILKQKNIDTGMGLERTLTVLNGFDDNYLTDLFQPIIKRIEEKSGKKYGETKEVTKAMRIIADHLKAAVFMISDGVLPSNIERGYVLRRLIRRAIRYGREIGLDTEYGFTSEISSSVIGIYRTIYPNIDKLKGEILAEIKKEEMKFKQTLEQGLKHFTKIAENSKELSGKDSFLLFQSYGFPIEMTEELAKEKNIKIDIKEFNKEFEKHQELSRTASAGTFKSGLADNSEQTTRLHTAAHLLLAALNKIIQQGITQKGSNITPERLRLDFNLDRKLTPEEIIKLENQVNEWIKQEVQVIREEMSLEDAKKSNAQGVFEHKYGNKVSIYTIGSVSKEICTGPHVNNTKELKHFKIIKEESVGAGIRRIKAIVE